MYVDTTEHGDDQVYHGESLFFFLFPNKKKKCRKADLLSAAPIIELDLELLDDSTDAMTCMIESGCCP